MDEKTMNREYFYQKKFDGLLNELYSTAEKVRMLIAVFQNEDFGQAHGIPSADRTTMFEVFSDYNNQYCRIIGELDMLRDEYMNASHGAQEAHTVKVVHCEPEEKPEPTTVKVVMRKEVSEEQQSDLSHIADNGNPWKLRENKE